MNEEGRALVTCFKPGICVVGIYDSNRDDRVVYKILFHYAVLALLEVLKTVHPSWKLALVGDYNVKFCDADIHPLRRYIALTGPWEPLKSMLITVGNRGKRRQYPVRTQPGGEIFGTNGGVSYRLEVPVFDCARAGWPPRNHPSRKAIIGRVKLSLL